jgi:ribonuclease G
MDVVVDEECPVCHGSGKIKSSILFVDTLERKIERLVNVGIKRFTLYVHPYVYAYIDKGIWSIKRQWTWKYKWAVKVVPSQELAFLQYRFVDTQGEEIDMKDSLDVKKC